MSFTDFFEDLFDEGGFGREVFKYLTKDEGGQMLTGLLGSYLANQSGFFGPNIPDVGYQGGIPDYQGMRQQVPVAMGQEYEDEQGQKYINPMGSGLGSIPQGYTLTNAQVPLMYDPNRRPGSGGRRYFTDMQYADTGRDMGSDDPVDQAAINQVARQQQRQAQGLLDLNLSNLAREQRSGSPVAPIPYQPYYPTPYGSDDDQDGGGQNGDDQDDGGQDGGFFPNPDKGGDENGAQDTDDGRDEDTQGADDGGQDDGGQGADDGYFKYVPLSGDDDGYTTGDPRTIANNEARDDLAFEYLTPEYLEGLGKDGFITLNDRRAKGLRFATLDDAIDFVDKWNRIGLKEEGLDPYKASSAYGGVPISPTFNYSGTEPLTYYQIPTNRTESGDSFQRTFTSKEDAINHLANGYYDDDYFNQSAQSFIDRINDSRKFKSEKNKIPDAVDLDFNDAEGLEQMFKDMGRWSNETQRLIRTYNDEGRRKLIERQIQTVTLNKQDAEGGADDKGTDNKGSTDTNSLAYRQQNDPNYRFQTEFTPFDDSNVRWKYANEEERAEMQRKRDQQIRSNQETNALLDYYTSDDYTAGVDPNDYISFNNGPAYLQNLKFATLEDAKKFLEGYNTAGQDIDDPYDMTQYASQYDDGFNRGVRQSYNLNLESSGGDKTRYQYVQKGDRHPESFSSKEEAINKYVKDYKDDYMQQAQRYIDYLNSNRTINKLPDAKDIDFNDKAALEKLLKDNKFAGPRADRLFDFSDEGLRKMAEGQIRTIKYARGGLASLSDNYRNRRRMFMPGPYASEPGRGRPNPYNNPISSSPGFPDDPISSSPGFPTPTRPDPRPNPYNNPIATSPGFPTPNRPGPYATGPNRGRPNPYSNPISSSPGFPDDQIIGQEDTTTYGLPPNDPINYGDVTMGVDDFGGGIIGQEDTTTYGLPYDDPRDAFEDVTMGVDDFGGGIIGQEDTTTYGLPSDDPRNEFANVGIGADDFGETPRDRFRNSDIGRRLRERVEKIRAGRGRNRPRGMRGFEEGGIARAAKGRYLNGSTDGMADKVPATIDGRQPAALSDGEFVIPADVVSHLGNGNSEAGAKVLQQMMARIRKERTGNSKQGKEIRPKKMLPA